MIDPFKLVLQGSMCIFFAFSCLMSLLYSDLSNAKATPKSVFGARFFTGLFNIFVTLVLINLLSTVVEFQHRFQMLELSMPDPKYMRPSDLTQTDFETSFTFTQKSGVKTSNAPSDWNTG